MKNLKFATALLISTTLLLGTSYAKTFNFESNLSGKNQNPHIETAGKGHIKASYNSTSKILKWNVTYNHMTGAATMAHFHGPATSQQNADVIIPIKPDALASPIHGSVKLNDMQAKQLMSGQWYFNIHTEKHPGGELRTQMIAK